MYSKIFKYNLAPKELLNCFDCRCENFGIKKTKTPRGNEVLFFEIVNLKFLINGKEQAPSRSNSQFRSVISLGTYTDHDTKEYTANIVPFLKIAAKLLSTGIREVLLGPIKTNIWKSKKNCRS